MTPARRNAEAAPAARNRAVERLLLRRGQTRPGRCLKAAAIGAIGGAAAVPFTVAALETALLGPARSGGLLESLYFALPAAIAGFPACFVAVLALSFPLDAIRPTRTPEWLAALVALGGGLGGGGLGLAVGLTSTAQATLQILPLFGGAGLAFGTAAAIGWWTQLPDVAPVRGGGRG